MRRVVLFLCLTLVLGACEDDGAGPDPLITEGLYTLRTINGEPLPYRLINVPGFLLHQIGGSLRLNPDRTFIERDSLRFTINDERGVPQISDTTVVFTGTWMKTDSLMELTDSRGFFFIGVINRNSLTLNLVLDTVVTYVYTR